jgi:hypothetical protein
LPLVPVHPTGDTVHEDALVEDQLMFEGVLYETVPGEQEMFAVTGFRV